MLEVRKFGDRIELVSDDANAENSIVSEALEGTPAGMRWDSTEVEGGELAVEIKPEELSDVASALAGAEYCNGAVNALDELAGGKRG